MILLNKEQLFIIFMADDFYSLSSKIEESAPSIVEYYLSNLKEDGIDVYFNKRDIENSIHFGKFSLYEDYSHNIYLENSENFSDEITSSFW